MVTTGRAVETEDKTCTGLNYDSADESSEQGIGNEKFKVGDCDVKECVESREAYGSNRGVEDKSRAEQSPWKEIEKRIDHKARDSRGDTRGLFDDKTETYEVLIEGEDGEESLEIFVEEQEYSHDEIQEVFQEVISQLDDVILGDNESFEDVFNKVSKKRKS